THDRSDSPPPAPPKESPPPPPRSLLFDPDSYSLEFNPFYTLNTLSLDRNAKSEYLYERNQQQHTTIPATNTQKPLPPNPPRHSSRRPQLYSPEFVDEFSGFPASFPHFIDESLEFGNLDTMRNYDYTATSQDFVFPAVGQGEESQETSSSNNSTKATTAAASTTSRLGGNASGMRKKGSCMELRDLYHLHADDDQEKRVALEVSARRAELLELQGLQEAVRMRKQSLRRSVSYTFLQQTSTHSSGGGVNQGGVGSNGSKGGNLSSFMESRQSQYHHLQQQDARNTKKKSGFVGWFKDIFAKKKLVDRSSGQTGIKSPTVVERVGVALTLRRNKSSPVSTYNSMLINPVPGGLAIAGVDADDEGEMGIFAFDD
ncbi:UNVERIFIED_CONTAM: hypothetical protein HDU68_003647, partial [Siphonaria sp. JEL0065]